MRIRPANATACFTLVELLAATAVLALLMVALVAMFDQAMRGWQNAQRGIDARREVRAALQFLESDLRGLVVAPGRPIFNDLVDNHNMGFDYNSRLTFLTMLSSNAQAAGNVGDLCAVQYSVERTNNSYRLIRRLQMSRDLLPILLANTNITQAESYFQGSPDWGELAFNVVYFRAEFKTLTNLAARAEGPSITRPDFVQMELTAYPRQVAQGFKNASDWVNSENIKKYAKAYIWRTVP